MSVNRNRSLEEEVQFLRARVQELEQDAHNRRLRLLSDLAEKLFSAETPVDAASAAFEVIAEELDLQAYFNFLPADDGNLILDSYTGIPPKAAHLIRHLEVGQAVCGLVAQTRRPIHATAIQESREQRVDLIRRYGLRAYFCNPLTVGDRFLGTLSFGTRSRDAFSDDDMELLSSVVRYVSLANERILSQKELRQAKEAAEEASRAKSQFLANMSHEIRTPMTVFSGAIEYLLQVDTDPERVKLLDMADHSARRLRGIIDHILDFSRIEARKVELEEVPFDVSDSLGAAVDMFTLPAREKDLRIRTEIAPETPERIVGDSGRIGQVLVNLIGNAVKFTHQGEVCVSVHPRGDFLEFVIADTGIGIPESKLDLLFQSFSQVDSSFTRRFGGTGLGLAISKGLVDLMGGEISVRSREGQGTVFTFTVPLKLDRGQSPRAGERGEEEAGAENSAVRILLADDEPLIREMLTLMLARRGFQVEMADSGKDAVEKWSRGAFEAVLMDLQMPEMNGLEATRMIRQKEGEAKKRSCIIGLTAHARREIHEDCLEAGMDLVLTKPVQMNDLYAAIGRCLGE